MPRFVVLVQHFIVRVPHTSSDSLECVQRYTRISNTAGGPSGAVSELQIRELSSNLKLPFNGRGDSV